MNKEYEETLENLRVTNVLRHDFELKLKLEMDSVADLSSKLAKK